MLRGVVDALAFVGHVAVLAQVVGAGFHRPVYVLHGQVEDITIGAACASLRDKVRITVTSAQRQIQMSFTFDIQGQ